MPAKAIQLSTPRFVAELLFLGGMPLVAVVLEANALPIYRTIRIAEVQSESPAVSVHPHLHFGPTKAGVNQPQP